MSIGANSEVLSPREFRRQVRRYLTLSALIWLALSLMGFLFLFRTEVRDGVSISLFSSGAIFFSAATAITILAAISLVWGLILALPTVALLALSNADSPFNARFDSSSRRMKRAFLSFLQPVLFTGTHLVFLWLSLATVPSEVRSLFHGLDIANDWSRVFYEIFYSERNEDHAVLWRKAFAGEETRALVVLLPASVLADAEYLPLIERELGSPVPFFVDAATIEGQVRQILVGGHAPGDNSVMPFVPANQVWKDISSLRELHVGLAPEQRRVEELAAPSARDTLSEGRLPLSTFLGIRAIQSQPHLYLLSRWGLLGLLLPGTLWNEVSAEDGSVIRRFLNDAVRSRRESRVRILQLSELDWNPSPFPRTAFRASSEMSLEERRRSVRDLDQILGRGFAALRNHPHLTVAVLPYPDFGSGTPLSHAFVHVPGRKPQAPGWMLARDFAPQMQAILEGRETPVSPLPSLEDDLDCQGVRLLPGAALEGGGALRTALWRGVLSYLEPKSSDVFFVPSEFSTFSADFHRFGVFCRPNVVTPGIPAPAQLALWSNEGEGTPMVLGPNTLASALLRAREPVAASGGRAALRTIRGHKPSPLSQDVSLSGLFTVGRLKVYSVPLRQPSPWLHELNGAESAAFLSQHGQRVQRSLELLVQAAEEE